MKLSKESNIFRQSMQVQFIRLFFSLTLFVKLFLSINLMSVEPRSVALLFKEKWKGESSFAYRLLEAGERIGWKVDFFPFPDELEGPPIEGVGNGKYDFCIHLSPSNVRFPNCSNYLSLFHPNHHYFDNQGYLSPPCRIFDGYLCCYCPNRLGYSNDFDDPNRFPWILWYPTVHFRDYQIVDPTTLFVMPSTWGDRSKGKLSQLFLLLDKEPYTRCFGEEVFRKLMPTHYCGKIPYNSYSLFEILTEIGVTLIIHSKDHFNAKVPSGRIFEAAASSTVIISDCNPFVVEHFGDAVLYIDINQSPEHVVHQIRNHMVWIQDHQKEALDKAKRVYDIFVEKFLLEDQMLRLGTFHDHLKKISK